MIGDLVNTVRTSYEGALLCDGSAIPVGSKYDALRNLIGTYTPALVNRDKQTIQVGKRSSDTMLYTRSLRNSNLQGNSLNYVAVNVFIKYKEDEMTQQKFNELIENSPVAKSLDMKFTDESGKEWRLVDIIKANLPFNYY